MRTEHQQDLKRIPSYLAYDMDDPLTWSKSGDGEQKSFDEFKITTSDKYTED
jgi:hypothetical protein